MSHLNCQVCPRVFPTIQALEAHVQEFQAQTRSILKEYTQCLNHVAQPLDVSQPLSPLFACQICKKQFDYEALIQHIERYRSLESRLVWRLVQSQSHVVPLEGRFHRTTKTQCPIATCNTVDDDSSNRKRHFQKHIPFIEPCGVCLKVHTSCHQGIKHKCQQSPSITEWTEKRSKEWSEERTRRLKIRVSQEYDCAIKACDESIFHEEVKAKRKIYEAPEPTRLDRVDTSNAGPSITNNAPALPDTYADNNELPEDHRIATQFNMRVSAEGNAGTNDATILTGEIVPDTGYFCMDDARTLETAHDFGFFCLDDTETRVATTWDADILDQNAWVQVQDLYTRGRDIGNRKRPPSMIS